MECQKAVEAYSDVAFKIGRTSLLKLIFSLEEEHEKKIPEIRPIPQRTRPILF
jgi:hypothetical protein